MENSKKVFSYKENSINFNVDAQIAGEAIEKIKEKNNGQVTPDDVVTVARMSTHPLHDIFDWNDASAAKSQRLHVARILIGSIVVTYKQHEAVRANYSVKYTTVDDKEKRAYVSIEEAVKPDYELQFRKEASNHLKVFCKRYESFDYLQSEVLKVRSLVDEMELKIKLIETEIEAKEIEVI